MFAMEAMLGRPAVQLKMPRLDAYTFAAIEVVSQLKGSVRSGLEAEFLVATLLCDRDDVREYGATCTATACSCRCAHGLDLAVSRREFLQRATANKLFFLPDGPERDVIRSKFVQIQCEHLFRW